MSAHHGAIFLSFMVLILLGQFFLSMALHIVVGIINVVQAIIEKVKFDLHH